MNLSISMANLPNSIHCSSVRSSVHQMVSEQSILEQAMLEYLEFSRSMRTSFQELRELCVSMQTNLRELKEDLRKEEEANAESKLNPESGSDLQQKVSTNFEFGIGIAMDEVRSELISYSEVSKVEATDFEAKIVVDEVATGEPQLIPNSSPFLHSYEDPLSISSSSKPSGREGYLDSNLKLNLKSDPEMNQNSDPKSEAAKEVQMLKGVNCDDENDADKALHPEIIGERSYDPLIIKCDTKSAETSMDNGPNWEGKRSQPNPDPGTNLNLNSDENQNPMAAFWFTMEKPIQRKVRKEKKVHRPSPPSIGPEPVPNIKKIIVPFCKPLVATSLKRIWWGDVHREPPSTFITSPPLRPPWPPFCNYSLNRQFTTLTLITILFSPPSSMYEIPSSPLALKKKDIVFIKVLNWIVEGENNKNIVVRLVLLDGGGVTGLGPKIEVHLNSLTGLNKSKGRKVVGNYLEFTPVFLVVVIGWPFAFGLGILPLGMVTTAVGVCNDDKIKEGDAWERAPRRRFEILDKTGTSICCNITIMSVKAFTSMNRREGLTLVVSATDVSEHLVIKSILEYASNCHFFNVSTMDCHEIPKGGISTDIIRKQVLVRSRSLLIKKWGTIANDIEKFLAGLDKNEKTNILMAYVSELIVVMEVAYSLNRVGTILVEGSCKMNVRSIMVTEITGRPQWEISLKHFLVEYVEGHGHQNEWLYRLKWENRHRPVTKGDELKLLFVRFAAPVDEISEKVCGGQYICNLDPVVRDKMNPINQSRRMGLVLNIGVWGKEETAEKHGDEFRRLIDSKVTWGQKVVFLTESNVVLVEKLERVSKGGWLGDARPQLRPPPLPPPPASIVNRLLLNCCFYFFPP